MPHSKPPRVKPPRHSVSPATTETTPQARRASAFEEAIEELSRPKQLFPNVSLRWLLIAGTIAILAALACAWLTLCLLYWQGSWQLLYHPQTAIMRTPASAGMSYQPVRFAATETGTPQLSGWWMPGAHSNSRFTILYLHGADGNLGDSVDIVATLNKLGLAIFSFDYRGYGQSQLVRPSEKQLRQDAEWALAWLTLTRHLPPKSILVYGTGLGADLALELAADHSELAGVVLDQPIQNPMTPVFTDPRSRLVPARWLVSDRYDLTAAVRVLRIPSLWLLPRTAINPSALSLITSPHTAVPLSAPSTSDPHFPETLQGWLDDLPPEPADTIRTQ